VPPVHRQRQAVIAEYKLPKISMDCNAWSGKNIGSYPASRIWCYEEYSINNSMLLRFKLIYSCLSQLLLVAKFMI